MKKIVFLICPSLALYASCSGNTVSVGGDSEPTESAQTPHETDTNTGADLGLSDERAACAESNPQRKVFFGDLHAHTSLSFDAYGYGVRVTPRQAYAFAAGSPVQLPPLDENGQGTRTVRLSRPLDFAALTDHGELLGEVRLCTTPGSPVYDEDLCKNLREGGETGVTSFGFRLTKANPSRFEQLCGNDGTGCRSAARKAWEEIQLAAEEAYDRTDACSFVSFVGYEYTSSLSVTNLHRNVLFKGVHVPSLPVTYFEAPTAIDLWRGLDESCRKEDGCEALLVPHNSNWSNGKLFTPTYPSGASVPEQTEIEALRARFEKIGEIFQHKGDTECHPALSEWLEGDDPACRFEKIDDETFEDCGDGTGSGGVKGLGCTSKLDFLRNVLLEGLLLRRDLGVNPYELSIVGSTDTHNGTPGLVEESAFVGHVGTADDTAQKRLGPGTATHDGQVYNPGGLAAIWAEELSRESLWAGLMRHETYATSGPRIEVRFFGGFGLDEDLCSASDLPKKGYAQGVPMGGKLTANQTVNRPTFVVHAVADPGTQEQRGAPLAKLEIIKGWLDAQGAPHSMVLTVAEAEPATLDESTCQRSTGGASILCGTFTDLDFDPTQPAFYYARAIESPSCRWSWQDCLELGENAPQSACGPSGLPRTIEERAWTSPIWYEESP